MDIDDELRHRVATGALFLDQTIPGWKNKIDVEALDLSNPAACVLGQLFDPLDSNVSGFTRGGFVLHDWAEFMGMDEEAAHIIDAGFEREGYWEDYETMTCAWLEVIANRV